MKKMLLILAMVTFASKTYADASLTNLIAGIFTGVAVTKIFKSKPNYWPDYRDHPELEVDCFNNPYYDNHRAALAWEKGCLQRRKQVQYMIEQEAYRQGYGRTW